MKKAFVLLLCANALFFSYFFLNVIDYHLKEDGIYQIAAFVLVMAVVNLVGLMWLLGSGWTRRRSLPREDWFSIPREKNDEPKGPAE